MLTNTMRAPSPFVTKSKSYYSSLNLTVIDINMYFGCYSYKIILQVLMSRIKLRNFSLTCA